MGECYLYKRGGGGSGGVGKVMTAVGSVIALTNSMNKPLKGLRIFGRTTQNGTPSPTAPVPLVSAGDGGSLDVMVRGKNLFGGVYNVRYSLFIPANTPFMVSTDAGSANTYFYAFRKDGTTLTYGSILNSITVGGTARKQRSWTLTEDVYAVSFQTAETGRYQIEIGSTATEYEPYKENQTMTFATPNGLPGIPVASGGNYTDTSGLQWVCDEVDYNRDVYVQWVDNFVFTGNESLGHSGNVGSLGFYCFVNARAVKGTANTRAMCNYFADFGKALQGTDGNSAERTNVISGAASTSFPRMVIGHDVLGTTASSTAAQCLSAVKAWLKARYDEGNPLVIMSKLDTPIETPLTAAEVAAYAALHTNSPNTTIYNDGGAEMEVKYMGG